jgi:hypothetical protein
LTFLNELKRHNVLRIAGLYLVAAWPRSSVEHVVTDVRRAGLAVAHHRHSAGRRFLPTLVFAWALRLIEGLKRESKVGRAGPSPAHRKSWTG